MERAGLVVIVALAACSYARPDRLGDAAGSDDGAGSGSGSAVAACSPASGGRIRLHGYRHADGFQVIRMHDATYDWDCAYALAGDGKLRCLPTSYDGKTIYGDIVYSDAACGTPILRIAPQDYHAGVPFAADEYRYDASGAFVGCIAKAARRVFNVQSKLAQPGKVYRLDEADHCVSAVPAGDEYYRATEIAPAQFVEGVRTHLGTGRIWIEAIDSPDGSRYCYDEQHGVELKDSAFSDSRCYDGVSYDEHSRCVLDVETIQSAFADASCTTALPIAPSIACNGTRPYAGESTTTACGAPTHRPKRKKSKVSAYYRQGTSCVAYKSYYDNWDVETEYIPDSEIAEITHDVTSGPGQRIKPRYGLVDGARFETFFSYDTVLQSLCIFGPGPGNVPSCNLTARTSIQPNLALFTAADCSPATKKTYGFVYQVDACNPDPPAFVVEYDATFNVAKYYRAGAEVTTPLYMSVNNGACQPMPPTSRAYVVGAEVTSMLATATEVVE
jgi:hypothetical protein